ncbi:hypothetical protein MMSR116_11860 [Methylobacterium mesophilicum SR1.6/6]|uniref:Secreted protein n=1 Tax=Methylobacterium mesophilicum SR1.6/6 TaxID=908290 RepID=A0A6B9FIU6_9HYPH|nr:hypothetical protein [Methylobacterium mesophilicum]QGY02490.1 hypothetical protein MMSR116_11860 [Methylobacterium mesophilicum SR1.6/6]
MVHRLSLSAAGACLALLVAAPSRAASDITAAAIAVGRLYVVGTTDQPHTKVKLDGKFETESDDKSQFQFELVYHPAGCIVRAAIGDKIVEAVVGQCGDVCQPSGWPAKGSPTSQQGRNALVDAQAPPTTSALVAPPTSNGETRSIRNPPLPPVRPDEAALFAMGYDPRPAAVPSIRPMLERAPRERPKAPPGPAERSSDWPDD